MNEGRLLKRLGNDYIQMLKTGKVFTSYSDGQSYIICVTYTEKHHLSIIVNNKYPFICPSVMINNISYCEYIVNRMNTMNGITTLLNIACPCCCNILHSWCPTYFMSDIIKQYDYTIKLLNTMQKMNYINKYILKMFKNCDNIFILRLIYIYLE